MASADSDRLRIDRWLWCARFFKTRSAAGDAVKGGHVRVNGQRVKPAQPLKVGDRIAIARSHSSVEMEVEVLAMPVRRGPAVEAQQHYQETHESILRGEAEALRRTQLAALPEPPTRGRPDKRTRRLLLARRGQDAGEE